MKHSVNLLINYSARCVINTIVFVYTTVTVIVKNVKFITFSLNESITIQYLLLGRSNKGMQGWGGTTEVPYGLIFYDTAAAILEMFTELEAINTKAVFLINTCHTAYLEKFQQ